LIISTLHAFQPPTSSDGADYVGRSPKLSLTTVAFSEGGSEGVSLRMPDA